MSLVGAAALGSTLGNIIGDGIILKYGRAQYEATIEKAEIYAKQLDQHLSTLEQLKDRLPECWDDDKAKEYVTVITTQIMNIRQAKERVDNLKLTYQEINEEFTGASEKITGITQAAQAALGKLGD